MALVSQGTFLPIKNVSQCLEAAHLDFKRVAKAVRGIALTSMFINHSNDVQKLAQQASQMTSSALLSVLESVRHQYYLAADEVADQAFTIHLLKSAISIHELMKSIKKGASQGVNHD
ncbi:hypothetical protein [Wohlfahrtiimonas chitiniclastica]|uniref:hypothetical protein n=1 Tax=Wohlfahrtiimonas chitiniclastica TaxID=400946 RepID=UPI000B98542C|nr:hypothetical protein [Wohlfahrtiimonas chitiniclastica]MBS7815870.1 hypothetical protein [Wohlfahrtiimonas chitiniclastica]MBS7822135.1 hypothetical protein [Wohlfahrtiimonas chitiniclastica]MBS7829927.1 hypothetical protein [Wohlfahrtiimonas chitiniclastica]MBS7831894.1 hypothetical protein [Wohlfahrtiimonas chitiniclastica]OYQ76101.1 hypothetical protein B9T18_01720 [Wohlfahrtiimonas chitiniclastica]